jgi:hypothetical protein
MYPYLLLKSFLHMAIVSSVTTYVRYSSLLLEEVSYFSEPTRVPRIM